MESQNKDTNTSSYVAAFR